MKQYFKSKANLDHAKEEYRREKKQAHKKFVKSHRAAFITLDLLMVLIVLFNIGAMVMTNMLVYQATPDMEVREANPIMAEVHDLEEHPESNRIIGAFLRQALLWIIFIGFYLHFRSWAFTEHGLMQMAGIIMCWTIILGLDFFNDLGFMLGKIIYGG